MKAFLKIFAVPLISVLVSACSTPTPYKPAEKDNFGYRDLSLSEGRYRISFRGNSVTPREQVEVYLLNRAAEITREAGYDYFILADRDTEAETTYTSTGPSLSAVHGFGRRSSAFGLGYHLGPSTARPSSRYESVAYITLHKGRAPKDNPQAYEAEEVLKTLEGRIIR